MQEIKIDKYSQLLTFLQNNTHYTVEQSIPDVKYKIIELDKYILKTLKDSNNNYYNLHCMRSKNKELNGIKEFLCYQIGNMIFKKYNVPYLKIIERLPLTEINFIKLKNKYKTIILKNTDQIFYENTLVWDWIKIV